MAHEHDASAIRELLARTTGRRSFLRTSALSALAGVAAACKGQQSTANPGGQVTANAASGEVKGPTGGTMGANDTSRASVTAAADAMDAMHEKVVKAFPAKTKGIGNQPLTPRVENGVKTFDLKASVVQWEVSPERMVQAWAYNDMVPGPIFRVKEGDRVRVNFTNNLPESTSIHWHGVEVANDQDGVPFITQQPIKPGQTFTYEFTAPNAGSHMYHSHHNSTKQVGLGLLGAFIVEPKDPGPHDKFDVEHIMILNDAMGGYTLNGKSFPATEPVAAKVGQTVRIRYMNEGIMIHPMHLHGIHQLVTHKDGWPLPQPFRCDTLNIAPGERWDVIVKATNPGTWAFHCHILPHAEGEQGMFGMVTALVVTK
jgi:FtsP/CotA-like multicopper oxidase with cupredoxin domain